ncbi:hypothetical protein BDF14DRAFT_1812218 [Spinellus fusiger]|nr:hypothetical protein BDF14DRAFT_1812218 [Spinellus fusiger]
MGTSTSKLNSIKKSGTSQDQSQQKVHIQKNGSARKPKRKSSKAKHNKNDLKILSINSLPLPSIKLSVSSSTNTLYKRSNEQPNEILPFINTTHYGSADSEMQMPAAPHGTDISLIGDVHEDNASISSGRRPLSINSSSYVGMTQTREPRLRIPKTRTSYRYSQRVNSTISCATTDSSQGGWMLSGGLFSQIDTTASSIITTITDYSDTSKASLSAYDWPKEDTEMISSSALHSPPYYVSPSSTLGEIQPKPSSEDPLHTGVGATMSLLYQLKQFPENTLTLLKSAFSASQESGYQHLQKEAYEAALALTQNTKSTTALVWIARCQIEGWGIPANPSQGFKDLKSMAENDGYWESFYPLALYYLHGLSVTSEAPSANVLVQKNALIIQKVDKRAAYHWFKKAAEIDPTSKGTDTEIRITVAKAQYQLGVLIFKQGEHITESQSAALEWFIKSADNNDKYAQYITGIHYERGILTDKNSSKAIEYLMRSAKQEFGDAEAALGIKYIEEGQQKEGMLWLKRATQKDNPRALLKLGLMYEIGQGVEQNNAIAISYYKSAANCNDARAQYILGLAYRMGILGLQQNYVRAEKYLTSSAQAGYAPSQRVLGLMFAQGLLPLINDNSPNRRRDLKTAILWFRRAAIQGDIRAIGLMGSCYENGQGTPINYEVALEYYRKAARIVGPFQDCAQLALALLLHRMSRHHDALNWFIRASASWRPEDVITDPIEQYMPVRTAKLMVARYQLHGWSNTPRNVHVAFDILYQLARQTPLDGHAHYWLAACYEEGIPERCEKDLPKAFEHYLIAAATGDVDAEFQVALMLSNGQGVDRDQASAFEWYKKAGQKEHKTALYSLGIYYAKGVSGITKDIALARVCFEKSARLGVVSAMTTLATLCKLASEGESPEAKEQQHQTVYWYERAAQYGDPMAQRELAILFDAGIGVEQSYEKALALLQKSAFQKDSQATLLLGNYYQNGYAVKKDLPHSIELYLEAARLGSPVATFASAQVYHSLKEYEKAYAQYKAAAKDPRLVNSRVNKASRLMVARYVLSYVPVNNSHNSAHTTQDSENVYKEDAFHILHSLAVEQQFESAYFWLADCFYRGNGTEVNFEKAIEWYKRSADETQDTEAILKLGSLYESGQGTPVDELTAFKYYKQAADHGSAEGQYKMGMASWRGLFNMPINLGNAILWFTWSAQQKYAESHWALGQMALENGDNDLATEWWRKAVAHGHTLSMRSLAKLLLEVSNQ